MPLATTDYQIIRGDCIHVLGELTPDSVDLTLSDIPYGISLADWDILHRNTNSALGGQSPAQRKMGSGFGRRGKPINGWARADLDRPREYEMWCSQWAAPLLRGMNPGGSVHLFGARRTRYRTSVAR